MCAHPTSRNIERMITTHRTRLNIRAVGVPETPAQLPVPANRDVAYRRLAATILRVDVVTLGRELRARRLERECGETAA
jgi:hypothetical protein